MNSIKQKERTTQTISHIVLITFALTALVPILLVLINSFKPHAEIVRNPLAPPTQFNLQNFTDAWRAGKFSTGFINSIILSGTTVIVTVITSTCMGYVLAGRKIKEYRLIMAYFLVAMTVPIQLFLIPLYIAFSRLGLISNLVAIGFVLAALNLPLAILLMRTFFLKVPLELEEAARIDGASTWQVLRNIMLPIVSPGIITVAIIVGLYSWNEFLITSTFISGQTNYTATLGFLSMNGTYTSNQGPLMAGAMIMIVPVVIFFLLMQKYFIDGLTSGAVKG